MYVNSKCFSMLLIQRRLGNVYSIRYATPLPTIRLLFSIKNISCLRHYISLIIIIALHHGFIEIPALSVVPSGGAKDGGQSWGQKVTEVSEVPIQCMVFVFRGIFETIVRL